MNMQNLMAQAQRVQRELTKKKEEIDNSQFEGTSEWVKVVINGKKELISLKITYTGPIEDDDKEMLEDMIKIAMKQATDAVDKEVNSKIGEYGALGGLF